MIEPNGERALVFAEIGQSHEGSLLAAKELAEQAAECGADALKVQIHIPESESTRDEKFRPGTRSGGEQRFDYWKRTSLTHQEWHSLREYARQIGLLFVPSAFSLEGLAFAESLQPDAIKVGSAETLQPWFMNECFSLGLPLFVSTGLSTLAELLDLVSRVPKMNPPVTLLQCVSKYPTPLADVGVAFLTDLKDLSGLEVGLSDHSGRVSPSLYALALGASVVEVHVKRDATSTGLDAASSITFDELQIISAFRDDLREMEGFRGKDAIAQELGDIRHTFGRSVATRVLVKKGEIIMGSALTFKKPGGGFAPEDVERITGKRASRDLSPDKILEAGDFE